MLPLGEEIYSFYPRCSTLPNDMTTSTVTTHFDYIIPLTTTC